MLVHPGQEDEAIRHFQTAIRLKPDYAIVHFNLGNSYAKLPGRMPEAIAEYETALQLRPNYVSAGINLGSALSIQGRKAEAIARWEAVLNDAPANITVLLNLALSLGPIPERRPEAQALVARALRLEPDNARARRLLAWLNADTR